MIVQLRVPVDVNSRVPVRCYVCCFQTACTVNSKFSKGVVINWVIETLDWLINSRYWISHSIYHQYIDILRSPNPYSSQLAEFFTRSQITLTTLAWVSLTSSQIISAYWPNVQLVKLVLFTYFKLKWSSHYVSHLSHSKWTYTVAFGNN